ncbi:hypothetical protein PAMP_007030 [Pampus punctatissimus]
MEGEREEQGECIRSGMTSTQVDTLTQNCSEEPQNFHDPEVDEQADGGVCDGEVEARQIAHLPPAGKFCGTQIIQTKMDALPDNSTWEESFGGEDEDSEEETRDDEGGSFVTVIAGVQTCGRLSKFRQNEYHSAVAYACSLGVYLERLEGLELLSVLSHSQRHYISSLNLEGFFSGAVHVHLNSNFPRVLHRMLGLTELSLSYSCLSDELLMALQHRHRGGRQNRRRDGITLQTFSLHCTLNEPHRQPVHGGSWSTLASNSPDLKVKITVDQVINTDRLARILQPEIPLTEYTMTAFYSPDEDWSAKPVLSDLLPQYRRSLQRLALDLSNCRERLDVELLELVKVCECLELLGVWAFLEVITIERLLHIRLTQRSLLNKIRVRIYSVNDNTEEQEDQLEQILSSHLQLPPELEFFAIIYPFE